MISITLQNKMKLQRVRRALFQSRAGKIVTALVSVALWLLVWHIAAKRLAKPLLLPTPYAVATRLSELILTKSFWKYTGRSLLRVVCGIVTGVGFAAVVSALTAAFRPVEILLSPVITVIKSTPVASFIILAMLWIDDDKLPVFIAFLMVFPVVWANLHTALRAIPTSYHELASVYRLPLWRRIRRIYAPHALPYFLSACKSSLGLAWKAGIAAEVIALPALSIGKQLNESKLYLETTDLFAWTVVVVVLSLVLETLAKLAFSRLQPSGERANTEKEASV
jgi:NitT/TauT family transport system permease protein